MDPTNEGNKEMACNHKEGKLGKRYNQAEKNKDKTTANPPEATDTNVEFKLERPPIPVNSKFCWYGKLLANCCNKKNKPNSHVILSFKASTI
ncbi:hypothetical protein WICPIJ_008715 [Wickerhamomyces pijperi]|uniref:Uncharacterized protein n=1 Tax=Wickerhamomyces pijperi TaxID=599730 RepID=A0A9P8PWY0_WICPI|nr:hypothetical protein WICPIJ_008715 [Wickerhamomyces pijperi]